MLEDGGTLKTRAIADMRKVHPLVSLTAAYSLSNCLTLAVTEI